MKKKLVIAAIAISIAALVLLRAREKPSVPSGQALVQEGSSGSLTKSTKSLPTNNRQPTSSGGSSPPGSSLNTALIIESVRTAREEILHLKDCLKSQACDFPQTDPRSYDFAVYAKWQQVISGLRAYATQDSKADVEIQNLARESMLSDDGHVQEQALEIMGLLPVDPKNLQSIVKGLSVNDADPLILQQAGLEMKRYVPGPDEKAVHNFFGKTLVNGGHFTAEQASLLVGPFIDANSVDQYREILRNLPKDSSKARNLSSALKDYDLKNSGG